MNQNFYEAVEDNPIIAAVKSMDDLEQCCKLEDIRVVFILFGDICSIGDIVKKIKAVKEMLGKDDGKKTAKRLDLEKGLLNWLKQRSLAQIFDWFDCLEETTVKTGAGGRRWTTESVARDNLFLELLGVAKS